MHVQVPQLNEQLRLCALAADAVDFVSSSSSIGLGSFAGSAGHDGGYNTAVLIVLGCIDRGFHGAPGGTEPDAYAASLGFREDALAVHGDEIAGDCAVSVHFLEHGECGLHTFGVCATPGDIAVFILDVAQAIVAQIHAEAFKEGMHAADGGGKHVHAVKGDAVGVVLTVAIGIVIGESMCHSLQLFHGGGDLQAQPIQPVLTNPHHVCVAQGVVNLGQAVQLAVHIQALNRQAAVKVHEFFQLVAGVLFIDFGDISHSTGLHEVLVVAAGHPEHVRIIAAHDGSGQLRVGLGGVHFVEDFGENVVGFVQIHPGVVFHRFTAVEGEIGSGGVADTNLDAEGFIKAEIVHILRQGGDKGDCGQGQDGRKQKS